MPVLLIVINVILIGLTHAIVVPQDMALYMSHVLNVLLIAILVLQHISAMYAPQDIVLQAMEHLVILA